MATDEERMRMTDAEYKQHIAEQSKWQREEIRLKKKIIKEKTKFLKSNKNAARKVLQNIKLQKIYAKGSLQAIKQTLQPIQSQGRIKYEEAGYFKKKEQKKSTYLGFL